jgi:hypothetical protein
MSLYRRSNPYASLDPASLVAFRDAAVQALIQMQLGGQPRSISYTQGDGSRSMEYQVTSLFNLENLIATLEAAIAGEEPRRAGPIRTYF